MVLSFNDNAKLLNFTDLAGVGLNTAQEASAFRRTQYFSKTNPQTLVGSPEALQSRYTKLSDLYLDEVSFLGGGSYGTVRQHNLTPHLASTSNTTGVDPRGLTKLLEHNLQHTTGRPTTSIGEAPLHTNLQDNYTDSKHPTNNLKFLITNTNPTSSYGPVTTSQTAAPEVGDRLNVTTRYEDSVYKSSNLNFLNLERNIRSLTGLEVGKTNTNMNGPYNNLEQNLRDIVSGSASLDQNQLYANFFTK